MLFFRWTGFGIPQFFLQFLCVRKVLIKNPDDAKLAPLGKLSNMQNRAAITQISFLGHNSIIIQDKWKIVASTPRFSWLMILIIGIAETTHQFAYAQYNTTQSVRRPTTFFSRPDDSARWNYDTVVVVYFPRSVQFILHTAATVVWN